MSKSRKEPRFIVIEGIDGAGTTTQSKLLTWYLEGNTVPAFMVREPTSGPIGSLIRQVLTRRLVMPGKEGHRSDPLMWQTMVLLFAADRLDNLDVAIQPKLNAGVTVICDRYYLSSFVYQAVLSEYNQDVIDWIQQVNRLARKPDLTIVLDVDPEIAARRRTFRGQDAEVYEVDKIQRQFAAAYSRAEELIPNDKVIHVNGNLTQEEAHVKVVEAVEALLKSEEGKGLQ